MSDIGVEINRHVVGADMPPPSVPRGIMSSQATLFKWLGSFWAEVYEDPDFVRYLQGARSARLSQLYLDVLEAAALVDRHGAPVFHRERWLPVRLLRSARNTASKGFLRIGAEEAVIGEQTSQVYEGDVVFTLGGVNVSLTDLVVFPVPESCGDVVNARCLCDSVASPSRILRRGTDFDIVNGTLLMRKADDPFAEDSVFPKFTVESEGGDDEETVVWMCDAEIDKDYVHSHLGYAMGVDSGSGDAMKRVVNAVWDAVVEGSTPDSLSALVSAMCGVPVALHDGEVVESVNRLSDGIYIVTNEESYRLSPDTEVAAGVDVGAKLRRFQALDGCVRVYPYVSNPDKLPEYLEFGDKFETDVPAIDIPPAIVSTGVDGGFSVGWDEREIVCGGFFDEARTKPKLWFRMDGSDADNAAFWNDVWARGGESGTDLSEVFSGCVDHVPTEEGEVCGSISPARFFLRNLVGANTVIVTVRTDALEPSAPIFDPSFMRLLRSCVPDHVRVFFIEHESVGGGDAGDGVGGDEFDLDESAFDDDVDAVAHTFVGDSCDLSSSRRFRARDSLVGARFVPKCRRHGR